MKISVEVVADLGQAQEMRVLRNECREFMTGSRARITAGQQRAFFGERIAPGRVHAWLLRCDGKAVAYGLLRPGERGELWMSCGVAAKERGKGYGTLMVKLVTAAAHDLSPFRPVRLEVWADNARARHVYEKAGYEVEREETRGGRVIDVMAHR